MKRTVLRHLWPLLALALLVWGAPVAAQTGAAELRVEPESLSLTAGQTQTVAIVIQDAAEVYGIDVRAAFDPALVEIVDADPARDGAQMTPGVFPQPDFVALNVADNTAGALRYAVTQVNPTPPANGGGTVFTFQVRGRANGVSPLRLTLVEMANRSGELLPVTTRDGAITVTGGRPPAPTGVALTAPVEGAPPAGVGAATAAPTVAAEATTVAEATSATAATAATAAEATAATAATDPAPATADAIIARATTGPTGPTAPPEPTLTDATAALPGATAAPPDATTVVTPAAAITDATTTGPEASAPVAGSAAPAVIGAGTDAGGPGAIVPPPAGASPGGALLVGGAAVLLLVVAVVLLARRGRG